ncbi:hypothetical protein E2N92_02545 [Methanofollis formosanus]|uniref:Uncharacterized protein n=1 Tax=Methanofollis formosanus TaxID=299308 RepID=A0A8G1EF05_9EURY|nr:hypothetical protein [Methanofollis formosanus]QYZ78390.1 hypothetical protein E2N92_02545 [Methanofollis formosanus]
MYGNPAVIIPWWRSVTAGLGERVSIDDRYLRKFMLEGCCAHILDHSRRERLRLPIAFGLKSSLLRAPAPARARR